MRIKKSQLRKVIREALLLERASQGELQKIEQLWWNDPNGDGEFPERATAKSLIDTLGIDPKSLKIWTLIYPWGEIYEPWTFYGGTGEAPGFSGAEIERIIEYYNSQTKDGLELAIDEWDAESGWADFTHPSGAWYDESGWREVSRLVEKAHFETTQ